MLAAMLDAPGFRANVFAHGVHVSTQGGRVDDLAGLNGDPHAAERFLNNVFNSVRILTTRAQGDFQPLTEIGDKMGLGGGIMCAEATEILCIEGVEVHWCSIQPVYFRLRRLFLLFWSRNRGVRQTKQCTTLCVV